MIVPKSCYASCREGRYGHTTSGDSLCQAAARAIEWWEQDCKHFGTAIVLKAEEVIEISRMGDGMKFQVKVGRIRPWVKQAPK